VDGFDARIDRQGQEITVRLSGELDMATAPTLEQALDGVTGLIQFDCTDLSFVDSSGLAIFSRVERNGGATLFGLRPNVRRVLEVAGLGNLISDS
jgi:anti-anti-sigma factor